MNLLEAVERACQEKTLSEALTWIAIWEAERAIAQALEWQRAGITTAAQGNWDLCFGVCFQAVIEKHPDRVCPKDSTLLPQSRQEAELMNIISERYLWPERFKTT